MRKVELRMDEQRKYEEIKNLVDHGGNKKRVALKLGISVRQVNRLIIIYKEKGKFGFIHGNRGKCPTKTLDKSFSENIILLLGKYYTTIIINFQSLIFSIHNILNWKVKLQYIKQTRN